MEMTEIPRLIVMYDDKNRIIVLTHHILDNFLHFLMHIFIPFKMSSLGHSTLENRDDLYPASTAYRNSLLLICVYPA